MTRDLLIVTLLFLFIAILFIGFRIYASHKLETIYDELFILEGVSRRDWNSEEYIKKYIYMVSFRKTFYIFLTYCMREEKFKIYHDFFEEHHPALSQRIDYDFSI